MGIYGHMGDVAKLECSNRSVLYARAKRGHNGNLVASALWYSMYPYFTEPLPYVNTYLHIYIYKYWIVLTFSHSMGIIIEKFKGGV